MLPHATFTSHVLTNALLPPVGAADAGSVTIGDKTNIQDGCVIGTVADYLGGHAASTRIGRMATIGHQASLHGCTVGDRALIGMNATLLEGSVVRRGWGLGRMVRLQCGAAGGAESTGRSALCSTCIGSVLGSPCRRGLWTAASGPCPRGYCCSEVCPRVCVRRSAAGCRWRTVQWWLPAPWWRLARWCGRARSGAVSAGLLVSRVAMRPVGRC